MNRYRTSGNIEDTYEPGSHGRVLKNKQGISEKQAMDEAETRAYLSVLHRALDTYDREHRFTADDLCGMHCLWLGDIYTWAGKYRTVNISKNGFTFAMARQVPFLMAEFEKGPLAEFTPCGFEDRGELVHALSVVHTEFVLIHPFREGNGRLARLLSVIMGLQAGLPPFDFSCIEENLERYFGAVQEGVTRKYELMMGLFKDVIERTLAFGDD